MFRHASATFASASAAVRRSATAAHTRAFHSPFAVLSRASTAVPATRAPAQAQAQTTATYDNAGAHALAYEKQADASPEPAGLAGARTYVVSDPDPTHAPYAVPSGAYPVSSPFAN